MKRLPLFLALILLASTFAARGDDAVSAAAQNDHFTYILVLKAGKNDAKHEEPDVAKAGGKELASEPRALPQWSFKSENANG